MNETSTGKICVLCNEDCSDRPRKRDRRGRYYCEPCYEEAERKIAARKAAMASASASMTAFDSDELSDTTLDDVAAVGEAEVEAGAEDPGLGAHACPECDAPIGPGAVLCVKCGYHEKRRKTLAVKEGASASGMRLSNPFVVAGLFLVVYVALAVVGRSNEMVLLGLAGWHGVVLVVVSVAAVVLAFREGIGQGLLTLLVPCYLIYFIYGVSESRLMKLLFAVFAIGFVIVFAMFRDQIMTAMEEMAA